MVFGEPQTAFQLVKLQIMWKKGGNPKPIAIIVNEPGNSRSLEPTIKTENKYLYSTAP